MKLIIHFCLMLSAVSVLGAEVRVFRDTQGREIKARGAIELSRVAEEPSSRIGLFPSTIPPRVIMGTAHIPDLADVPLDDWKYVREHLDGMYLNAGRTGISDVRKLVQNIKSKKYFFIGAVKKAEFDEDWKLTKIGFRINVYNALKDGAEQPSLVLVNDYISKKGKDPTRFYSDGFMEKGIEYLHKEIGENSFGRRLYITMRNGHFERSVYNKTYDPGKTGNIVGRAFSTMLYVAKGGGFIYETSPFGLLEEHQERYIQAFNRSRELSADFLWICGRGQEGTPTEWSSALVKAYKWLEENELFPDGIIIMQYSRTALASKIKYLDMLPMMNESDPSLPAPGSFTGALYWGIKQREQHATKTFPDK